MKKNIIASIVSSIFNFLTLILYGFILFILALTVDFATSLGGEVTSSSVIGIIIFLIIAIVLSILNIVSGIILIIKIKRQQLGEKTNTRKTKIFLIVSLIIEILCNIALFILTWKSWISWIILGFSVIFLICVVLALFDSRNEV